MSEEKINTPPNPEDTRTRKTIRLKPLTPKVPGVTPVAPSAPAPAGDETRTRKTIRLKPLMPHAPAAANDDDKTVKLQKAPVPTAGEVSTETQPTVKIKRSPLPEAITPMFDSTKTQKAIKMSKEAPTVVPASISIDDDRTVKIKRSTVDPAAIPAVKITPAAAPKIAPIKPVTPPQAAPGANIPKVSLDIPAKSQEEMDASSFRLRLVMTILATIAILVAATITTVHYLDINHDIQIESYVPGLPSAK